MLEQLNFHSGAVNWRRDRVDGARAHPPAGQTDESSRAYLEPSLAAMELHLPQGWADSIRGLLISSPISVRVVRNRRSKHGDHRFEKFKQVSVITVNASGNGYRFGITLLHEIAHAQVSHRYRRRTKPHGREWKEAFRNLLLERLELFPNDLREPLIRYAQNPLYTTDADSPLSQCLRRYDTLDVRPTVLELACGQKFLLNGKRVMTKGELLRKRYRCVAADGGIFHVSPSARVDAVYNSSSAGHETGAGGSRMTG